MDSNYTSIPVTQETTSSSPSTTSKGLQFSKRAVLSVFIAVAVCSAFVISRSYSSRAPPSQDTRAALSHMWGTVPSFNSISQSFPSTPTFFNSRPSVLTPTNLIQTSLKVGSNDCALSATGTCWGIVTKNPYKAVRQCTKGLKATKCQCETENAQVVYSKLIGPRCFCDIVTNAPKVAIWKMWLSCVEA